MKELFLQHRKLCFASAIVMVVAAVFFYMTIIEPRWLKIDRQEIVSSRWHGTAPLTILHLSDFHVSIQTKTLKNVENAIRLGLECKPDLICVTGDFVTGQFQDANTYIGILSKLGAAAPAFACLGNHDGGSWTAMCGGRENHEEVEKWLTAAGITPLVNDIREVTIKGQKVRIAGLGDLWNQKLQPNKTLAAAAAPELTILLAHNPDAKESLPANGWDLMLCGHTHGGQLSIPFIGQPFSPVRDKNLTDGLHKWQGHWIYITAGVGNLHGVRLNSRPQVSIIKIFPGTP